MDEEKPPYPMTLSDDRASVTIEFPGALTLDVAALEELILWLGLFRSKAAPSIPKDYRQAPRFLYADEIQMVPIPPDGSRPATQTGANFLFQSPLFGWFQHPATPEFCRHLIHFLLSQGATPPPDSPKH